MPMNADMLAMEMLAAIGGKSDAVRIKAFKKLAQAIVLHIQKNAATLGTTSAPGTPIVAKIV
jgi:hypothetical protein